MRKAYEININDQCIGGCISYEGRIVHTASREYD